MASRYTKSIPEHIYFVGDGEWIQGPYVKPQQGRENRKFLITEVSEKEEKKKKELKDSDLTDQEFYQPKTKEGKFWKQQYSKLCDEQMYLYKASKMSLDEDKTTESIKALEKLSEEHSYRNTRLGQAIEGYDDQFHAKLTINVAEGFAVYYASLECRQFMIKHRKTTREMFNHYINTIYKAR